MAETDKKPENSSDLDVFTLLSTPIPEDIEQHLKARGLSWFFKRRQRFQKYLERRRE